MGQSPPSSYNKDKKGIPLINGPVEFEQDPFSKTVINQYTTKPTKMCEPGDLILCVRGSTTGRMILLDTKDVLEEEWHQLEVKIFRNG